MTLITTLHTPPAGIVPFVSATDSPFCGAVTVPPQPLLTITPLEALSMPPGYGSVNWTPVIALEGSLFVNAMVICEESPTATFDGLNALLTVGAMRGALAWTENPAIAEPPVSALPLGSGPV